MKAKKIGDETISSGNIQEAAIQTIPTPLPTFSINTKKRHHFNTTKSKKFTGQLCQKQRRHKIRTTGSNPLNSKHNVNV